MIIDVHTHVFPASFIEERDALIREEPVFAELYRSAGARMVTATDLVMAMDQAGVDRAVIAGFGWVEPWRCVAHNDELLGAAERSGGRLIPFCCVPVGDADSMAREMERCVAAGAAGFGELRLERFGEPGVEGGPWDDLGVMASALDAMLLLHASEPVGHDYPGKGGGSLAEIWRFLSAHSGVMAILAHLGGGLPFYAYMPEVRALFERVYVDTAAAPWLYEPAAVRAVIDLIGRERVLFGSDYPLRHPGRDLRWLRGAGLDERELAAVCGENAAVLLKQGGLM